MPWSPVPKIPDVIESVKKRGYTHEVSTEILSTEIMRVLGVIKPNTIKRIIEVMKELGYIYKHDNGIIWCISTKEEA